MAYSQKLTMLLHDIEELDLAELSLLSEKIVELSKHKDEKTRLQLLQRNADQDPARVQKIEEVLTSFQERRFDPSVSILSKVIKEKFGIILANTQINARLKSQWLLSEIEGKGWRKRTVISEKSGEYGIYTEQKTMDNGFVYDAILFTPKGMKFILEHIKEIVKFIG